MTSKGNLLATGTNNPREIKPRVKPNSMATSVTKKGRKAEGMTATMAVTRSTHNDVKVLKTLLKLDTFDEVIKDLIKTKFNLLDEDQQELFKLLTKMNKE